MYGVTVPSPLAGCLALADLYRQRLADPSWRQAWNLIWDKVPRATRGQVQPIAHLVEVVEQPSRTRADLFTLLESNRLSGPLWAEVRAQLGVPNRADGDAWTLWRTVEDWLAPHNETEGVWSWRLRDVLIRTESPKHLVRDDRGRLHATTRAAVEYDDGFAVCAWHGVRVSADAILKPQSITVEQIEHEQNVEVRRVLIERYGVDRYVQDCGAREIHRDSYGILYRKGFSDDEPLVVVCVKNSTPEPDGSSRFYWLRVHPACQTAKQAVAWTFGMTPEEYDPEVET